ncbi:MAG: FAD-binding oxidoreductase [Proteobacteria bacterium]|nr:FAD-binding oxidoreductase [Pseudomonadota bacterium]
MTSGGASTPLAQLQARFGPELISTDPAALAAAGIDHRRLYHGRPLAIASPRNTLEVSQLLAFCDARRIGVVPQGGNTGYCGAATPDESGTELVLSLRRMRAIRRIDPANDSMVVESGLVLAEAQQVAAAAGRFFPLSLGSEGSCQIGGNLATNAGGVQVLRYGMMRELVLGLEVVLADGRVLSSLDALRKDNTGYDLRHLFIGAEGTLGVITAAALRLFPPSRAFATAFIAVPDPQAAVALLGALRSASGDRVSSFELLPRIALELVLRHLPDMRAPLSGPSPWFVLCELTSARAEEPLDAILQDALGAAFESGLATDAALAQGERERREFWRLRENIPEAQRRDGPSLKHDVSLPIDRLPAFVEAASAWVAREAPMAQLVCYGHVGDGNLHFNLGPAATIAAAQRDTHLLKPYEDLAKRAIHDLVRAHGGSFSAEHGIGRLKVDELQRYASPVELGLMRAIKQAFDPNGIMNPGKVLPRSACAD